MTTVFGSAIPCRRAARFGVSPTMPRSCASPDPIRSPTTTSPVAMPTRVCSGARVLSAVTARDQLQPRPHRPLGVVLMRLRIAEIDQHAVAHVFRHEAAEAAHGLGDAFLIGRNDLAQVLGVHAGGERRRTDQVREHHRDLAALGGVVRLRFRTARAPAKRTSVAGTSAAIGLQQLLAMAERRDANVLEIVVGQPASSSPSMSLARNISAYWARPIPRSQPSMSKFSPLGSCQRQFLKRVESSAPAVIPRGFSNQPWIRHVDANHSTAA